jgi:hypothetical protein
VEVAADPEVAAEVAVVGQVVLEPVQLLIFCLAFPTLYQLVVAAQVLHLTQQLAFLDRIVCLLVLLAPVEAVVDRIPR